MTYLIASSVRNDLLSLRESSPETWRQVRRYNLPAQLALAAAGDVMPLTQDPATTAIISLAPCQPGSADLYRWGHVVTAGMKSGTLGNLRMNPTQTLHAVDNLALSALAISYGNRSYCLGLGGAAGQAWCGLEAVQERLRAGMEEEAVVVAGDQDAAEDGTRGLGIALLFSVHAKAYPALGRTVRLLSISRKAQQTSLVVRHAVNGLAALLSAIVEQKQGRLSYVVPPEHTDGLSSVTVSLEIS